MLLVEFNGLSNETSNIRLEKSTIGFRFRSFLKRNLAIEGIKLTTKSSLHSLDERSREVFRSLVELYIETGEPTGSRTIAKNLSEQLSAATVRNVMQDLEQLTR